MLTETSLDNFCGTENYYQHWANFKYTDGIKYLAEKANCYWLLDVIGSYLPKFKQYGFQLWELKVNDDKSAIVTMKEDTCNCCLVQQKIDYTDFPLKEIKLYFIDSILLLPSEY